MPLKELERHAVEVADFVSKRIVLVDIIYSGLAGTTIYSLFDPAILHLYQVFARVTSRLLAHFCRYTPSYTHSYILHDLNLHAASLLFLS